MFHIVFAFEAGVDLPSKRIFSGISQNFSSFEKRDFKIFIFQKNLRNFAEILQISEAKLRKICLKKMYALNVFGGTASQLWNLGHPTTWARIEPASRFRRMFK